MNDFQSQNTIWAVTNRISLILNKFFQIIAITCLNRKQQHFRNFWYIQTDLFWVFPSVPNNSPFGESGSRVPRVHGKFPRSGLHDKRLGQKIWIIRSMSRGLSQLLIIIQYYSLIKLTVKTFLQTSSLSMTLLASRQFPNHGHFQVPRIRLPVQQNLSNFRT